MSGTDLTTLSAQQLCEMYASGHQQVVSADMDLATAEYANTASDVERRRQSAMQRKVSGEDTMNAALEEFVRREALYQEAS